MNSLVGAPPTVSVVLITYNDAPYIGAVIASVLAQTLTNFELIIVNDGATDETDAIVRRYKDPRITYIVQENQGVSVARNAGIAQARGAYIAILSGDDLCYPQRLARQVDAITAAGDGVVFSWIDAIDEDGHVIEAPDVTGWLNRPPPTRAEQVRRFFTIGNTLCAPTAMLPRAVFERIGLFCPTLIQVQDFDLWVRAIRHYPITVIPERLVGYRIRAGLRNLTYNPANALRLDFEIRQVYRRMLDDLPVALLQEAFADRLRIPLPASEAEETLARAFLYLDDSRGEINYIGLEKLTYLLQDERLRAVARDRFDFGLRDLFECTKSAGGPSRAGMHQRQETDAALQRRVHELEEAREWLEEQRRNWVHVAAEREGHIRELEAWNRELETAKEWLEGQRRNWERIAAEREGRMRELEAWNRELEAAKEWLEEQRRNWERVAAGRAHAYRKSLRSNGTM